MTFMPPKIDLAQLPTPLQPLDRLSDRYGGPRIWIKRDDLTGCAATGNKVRKLEFILADVLDKRCDTVITCGGVQSNHCRSTAILSAQLGLKTHLVLRLDSPADNSGNLFISKLAGAENVTIKPSLSNWVLTIVPFIKFTFLFTK